MGKKAGHVLSHQRYMGDGTVDMAVNYQEPTRAWHARKQTLLHETLEDGTPPFHSIITLGSTVEIYRKLYGSTKKVSNHTSNLIKILYKGMNGLTYANGGSICEI